MFQFCACNVKLVPILLLICSNFIIIEKILLLWNEQTFSWSIVLNRGYVSDEMSVYQQMHFNV